MNRRRNGRLTEEEELQAEEEVEGYIVGFCLGEEEESDQVEEGDGEVCDTLAGSDEFQWKEVLTSITRSASFRSRLASRPFGKGNPSST
jgi:hypothetical protein